MLGNNQVCQIKGIGKVKLKLDDGPIVILSEVRYIPEVKRNLISLGLLEKKGCSFYSFVGTLEVKKDGILMLKGTRNGILYYLCGWALKSCDQANAVKSETIEMWHMRLGHPADGSIKELLRKEVIHGTERAGHLCIDCILGKTKKLPYQKGKHTSKAPLDYVHSDL